MMPNELHRLNEGEAAGNLGNDITSADAYQIVDDTISNTSSIDPYSYISMIEQSLLSQSEEVFRLRLKPEYQKLMIQILLGIPDKVQFSKLLRVSKNETEFKNMAQFTRDTLHPHICTLPNEVRSEKVPNIDHAIEQVLGASAERGSYFFERIATGKKYRGKLVDMLQDIAPELLPMFQEAMMPLTEAEVFLQVIESVSRERMKNDDELDPVRIQAARKCIQYFSRLDATSASRGSRDTFAKAGTANGKNCEKACVNWLQHRHRDTQNSLLQNVFVTTKCPRKYASSIGRTKVTESESNDSSFVGPGVLWTNIDRNKSSSEFDALVIKFASSKAGERIKDSDDDVQLVEVWEAKFTVSPSTLRDAITKKLPAMKSILEDEDLRLLYIGKEYKLKDKDKCCAPFVFGIFAQDILPPPKAVGHILSSIVSDVLAIDVENVLNAIKSGFVEIKAEMVYSQLRSLKNALDNIGDVNLEIKVSKSV